ncbi:SDR family NAD(P)-dependent oxidoreductase [Ilumatobacter sp.]|uniref:SDR family NAD(P)-dependent oxidoreductase n=1 Tax=Ilumatobacter sp. TaxID=1967498 RepID=UPI003AF96936
MGAAGGHSRFASRTAIVTGAGGDIGATTAVRLAEEGARVVLADVAGAIDATAEACAAANPDLEPIVSRFDVTSEDEVRRAFDELGASGVVADLLFNNAGIQGSFDNVVDQDLSDFRRVLDVNVAGAFLVLRGFARALTPTGRPGSIVNTASMAQGGAPNMAAYSASKAAVVALTKTAAKDLAHASIRVNSVSPAFIGPGAMWDRQVALQAETPSRYFSDDPDQVAAQMIGSVPLRRYGSLDEVAAAVLFLLSDESSYITGVDLHVSGGAV